MKGQYLEKFQWLFRYTSKSFAYRLVKTLCLVVGLPLFAVTFLAQMALLLVNVVLHWIPILNIIAMLVAKLTRPILDLPFALCIAPDYAKYRNVAYIPPAHQVMRVKNAQHHMVEMQSNATVHSQATALYAEVA